MQHFVADTSVALGETEPTVGRAAGILLAAVREQLSAADFEVLSRRVSGLRSLLEVDLPTARTFDLDQLQSAGLSATQATKFARLFVNFLRQEGGERIAAILIEKLPELRRFSA